MGNNDRHFWGSNGQHKSFKEQGSFSLRHIMVKVGLLVGNKGILNLRVILTPREQRKAEKISIKSSYFNWVHSLHTDLMNAYHSTNLFTSSCDHISTNDKGPPHSHINHNTPQFLYSL